MRFENDWRSFELTVMTMPEDDHDMKMIEEMTARIVKELVTVDESVIIEISEYNSKEEKYAWVVSIADVDKKTDELMLTATEGLEIWISESKQNYEATCFSKPALSYNGVVQIDVMMFADEKDSESESDSDVVEFQENAYARQVLHTAHMCYRETITDMYKDWATRYINSPNYEEAYRVE